MSRKIKLVYVHAIFVCFSFPMIFYDVILSDFGFQVDKLKTMEDVYNLFRDLGTGTDYYGDWSDSDTGLWDSDTDLRDYKWFVLCLSYILRFDIR